MNKELDFDDERVIELLRKELDRRELAKQDVCSHLKSGTIQFDSKVKCDGCGKIMGEEERDNAFKGAPVELAPLERRRYEEKA